MRTLSAILFTSACVAWLLSVAFRTPWNGGRDDFAWVNDYFNVSVGTYGVVVYVLEYDVWDKVVGTDSYALYLRPPRLQHGYISKAAARMLRDDRAWEYDPTKPKYDPDFRHQYDLAAEKDRDKEWTWPNY